MKLLLTCIVIFCSYFSQAQYKQGHYYKNDGTKVDGLLRFEFGGDLFTNKENGDCSISYKSSKDEKRVRLTTDDISSFVIETDSFAIIKNFQLNYWAFYPKDFAQVLKDGKIKLYLYYSVVNSSGRNSYSSST